MSTRKPPSEAQLAANRANAAKSTGPKSPAGKARSSMNAWKHGLTAKSVCLTHENQEEFEQLALAYRTRYRPADVFEVRLLDQIILVHWNIDRLRNVQDVHIELEIDDPRRISAFYREVDLETDSHLLPALAYRVVAESTGIIEITNRQLTRLAREYTRLNQAFFDVRRKLPIEDPDLEPATEPAAAPPVQNEAKLPPPVPVDSPVPATVIAQKAKEVTPDIRPPLIARAAA